MLIPQQSVRQRLHLADSALHAPQGGFGDRDAYLDLIVIIKLNGRSGTTPDHDNAAPRCSSLPG